MKYIYPEGSRELSGFGGNYEKLCRDMVVRGLKYLEDNNIILDKIDSNDAETLQIVDTESDNYKKLRSVVIGNDDPSFAMLSKALQHINIIIRYNYSWDDYISALNK